MFDELYTSDNKYYIGFPNSAHIFGCDGTYYGKIRSDDLGDGHCVWRFNLLESYKAANDEYVMFLTRAGDRDDYILNRCWGHSEFADKVPKRPVYGQEVLW